MNILPRPPTSWYLWTKPFDFPEKTNNNQQHIKKQQIKKDHTEGHDQFRGVCLVNSSGNLPKVECKVHKKIEFSFECCMPVFWCLSGLGWQERCWQLDRGNDNKEAASVRFSTCVAEKDLFLSYQAKARVTEIIKARKENEVGCFILSPRLGKDLRNIILISIHGSRYNWGWLSCKTSFNCYLVGATPTSVHCFSNNKPWITRNILLQDPPQPEKEPMRSFNWEKKVGHKMNVL